MNPTSGPFSLAYTPAMAARGERARQSGFPIEMRELKDALTRALGPDVANLAYQYANCNHREIPVELRSALRVIDANAGEESLRFVLLGKKLLNSGHAELRAATTSTQTAKALDNLKDAYLHLARNSRSAIAFLIEHHDPERSKEIIQSLNTIAVHAVDEADRIREERLSFFPDRNVNFQLPDAHQLFDSLLDCGPLLPEREAQALVDAMCNRWNPDTGCLDLSAVAEDLCGPNGCMTLETLLKVLKDPRILESCNQDLAAYAGIRQVVLPDVDNNDVADLNVSVSKLSGLECLEMGLRNGRMDLSKLEHLKPTQAGAAVKLMFRSPPFAKGVLIVPGGFEVDTTSGHVVRGVTVIQRDLDGGPDKRYLLGARPPSIPPASECAIS